jgi:hypothetical protein
VAAPSEGGYDVTTVSEPRVATPVAAVEQPEMPRLGAHRLRTGVRLNIRGRTLRLRGVRAPQSGALAFLSILGPGLIAAIAGDDAGGIATYSQVGAKYGYDL